MPDDVLRGSGERPPKPQGWVDLIHSDPDRWRAVAVRQVRFANERFVGIIADLEERDLSRFQVRSVKNLAAHARIVLNDALDIFEELS